MSIENPSQYYIDPEIKKALDKKSIKELIETIHKLENEEIGKLEERLGQKGSYGSWTKKPGEIIDRALDTLGKGPGISSPEGTKL
jgi:hypothetical protein